MFQKFRRRDLILITGLICLACLSVFAVTLLILRAQPRSAESATTGTNPASTPGPQPTHTVTYVAVTGLNQYQSAVAAAQSWAADAQLVSASANWPFVTAVDQIGEPTVWNYRFYSPAKRRLFFVKIEPEGQVETIEHAIKVTLPPQPIAMSDWLLDSSAALAIWLDYGGAKMLQTNPGLELLVQLRSTSQYTSPVWVVTGVDDRTELIRVVAVDAREGVVLTTSSEN